MRAVLLERACAILGHGGWPTWSSAAEALAEREGEGSRAAPRRA